MAKFALLPLKAASTTPQVNTIERAVVEQASAGRRWNTKRLISSARYLLVVLQMLAGHRSGIVCSRLGRHGFVQEGIRQRVQLVLFQDGMRLADPVFDNVRVSEVLVALDRLVQQNSTLKGEVASRATLGSGRSTTERRGLPGGSWLAKEFRLDARVPQDGA